MSTPCQINTKMKNDETSAQVEGQTDEEIADEAVKEIQVGHSYTHIRGELTRSIILAALRAKSEKPQSSGKKEAPSESEKDTERLDWLMSKAGTWDRKAISAAMESEKEKKDDPGTPTS